MIWWILRCSAKLGVMAVLNSKSRAWAQIDLTQIEHNVQQIRQLIPASSKIMGIVKADAYGHGDVECTRELERCGVDFFAVSSVDEGVHLREHGIHSPILILGYTPPAHFHYLHECDLIQTLVDLPYAKKLEAYAKAQGCVIEAHVKADTGMSRIGVIVQDHAYHIEEILKMYAMKHVKVTGIFSHFSVSDSHTEEDLAFTAHQIELFDRVLSDIQAAGFDCGVRHLQNSYGILNYPDLHYDYVRPGLLYMGVTSDDQIPINTAPDFHPILSLHANVTMVKMIAPGVSVSYGRHFRAERETKVASVSIGYADGIPRILSNTGFEVLLHGVRVPIIGNICMDQLMIDVTGIPEAREGDEVTLLGRDGTEAITMEELAKLSGRFHYEIPCLMGKRLPRVYVSGGRTREAGEL